MSDRGVVGDAAVLQGGDQGARVSMRSIYLMAALAAGLAIFLLWLLFGGRTHSSSQACWLRCYCWPIVSMPTGL